jgi:hypothetical protein
MREVSAMNISNEELEMRMKHIDMQYDLAIEQVHKEWYDLLMHKLQVRYENDEISYDYYVMETNNNNKMYANCIRNIRNRRETEIGKFVRTITALKVDVS